MGKMGKQPSDFVQFCHCTNRGGKTMQYVQFRGQRQLMRQLDTILLLSTLGLVVRRRLRRALGAGRLFASF